jgi:hypothetical protein
MEFITTNWTEIAGVIALVVVVGERIAALTETKKDDAIFGAIYKVLKGLGLKFPEAPK